MTSTVTTVPRLLKTWGNEAVIFDIASGDTHYLKPLTLALYQICLEHPGSFPAELASMLATRLGFPETPELLELTENTLQDLNRINLLEPA